MGSPGVAFFPYLLVDSFFGSRSDGEPTKEFKHCLALRSLSPYNSAQDDLDIAC
jgi:hypothetical protein